jgi:hypothetical protein
MTSGEGLFFSICIMLVSDEIFRMEGGRLGDDDFAKVDVSF